MKIEIQKLECIKCGHMWYPTQPIVTICPKCKTKFWNSDEERLRKPYEKRK